jgi:DNA-binding NarL/FixJ family response regulator
MIHVLVSDAYPLFRQGIRAAIGETPDIQIVGESEDPEEIVRVATATNPEVVICDRSLPGAGGLDLTRRLRLHAPNLGVILISTEEDEEYLFEAIKAGASAHLLRQAAPDELLDTIRRVARGEHLIDDQVLTRPAFASKVLHKFNTLGEHAPQDVARLFAPLSPREIEVLEQISHGNSNKQIARNLTISDQTVKNHITSILKKLAVNDRTEAVVYSLRQGWIRMDGVS